VLSTPIWSFDRINDSYENLVKCPDSCYTVARRNSLISSHAIEESKDNKWLNMVKPASKIILENLFRAQATYDGGKYKVKITTEASEKSPAEYGVMATELIAKNEIIGPVLGKVILLTETQKVKAMNNLFSQGFRRREIKTDLDEVKLFLSCFRMYDEINQIQDKDKLDLYVIPHEFSTMGRINSSLDKDEKHSQKHSQTQANAEFQFSPLVTNNVMENMQKIFGDRVNYPPLFIYQVKATREIKINEEILIEYEWSDSKQVNRESSGLYAREYVSISEDSDEGDDPSELNSKMNGNRPNSSQGDEEEEDNGEESSYSDHNSANSRSSKQKKSKRKDPNTKIKQKKKQKTGN
jgi:hypothetical protein